MPARGRPPVDDVLTPAEWEVVHMVRHGMTNRRIARQRGTSLDGVKFHLENIRAKLGLPDRKSVQEWAGKAKADPWSTPMTQPVSEVHLGPLGQVAHTVRQLEPTLSFFKETLGMTHLFSAGELAFFDCGGTRLMLDALPEAQGSGNSILYFKVDAIHGVVAALREKGVAFEGEPHRIHTHPDGTEEWMAFFKDPEGNMLGLMGQVKP